MQSTQKLLYMFRRLRAYIQDLAIGARTLNLDRGEDHCVWTLVCRTDAWTSLNLGRLELS